MATEGMIFSALREIHVTPANKPLGGEAQAAVQKVSFRDKVMGSKASPSMSDKKDFFWHKVWLRLSLRRGWSLSKGFFFCF